MTNSRAPLLWRIPLELETDGLACIDDLDLAFLVQHGGGTLPIHWHKLGARNGAGEMLAVQWLSGLEPSLAAGQRRGTLMVESGRKPRPGEGGRRSIHLLVAAGPADAGLPRRPDAADKKDVHIRQTKDILEVTIQGQPLVTYHFNTRDPQVPRPYFHPLIGPTGQVITQMGEVPGKRVAHFHHTALWLAHQNFTARGQPACDNWQIGRPNSSKIEHVRFDSVQSGPLAARFSERLHWLNVKGDLVLLEETRTVTIPRRQANARIIDLDIRLKARDLPVTLNRTPYHLLAVRVLNALLPGQGGVIRNSAGMENPGDGAPADWIDISGRLQKTWQGVALFNHSANLRSPTPCLQFARQTIGLSPTHRQPHTIEPKQELRLRFRVYVHAGNAADGRVAAEYQAYVKPAQMRIGGPEVWRG